jgi:hypothetical protein
LSISDLPPCHATLVRDGEHRTVLEPSWLDAPFRDKLKSAGLHGVDHAGSPELFLPLVTAEFTYKYAMAPTITLRINPGRTQLATIP